MCPILDEGGVKVAVDHGVDPSGTTGRSIDSTAVYTVSVYGLGSYVWFEVCVAIGGCG